MAAGGQIREGRFSRFGTLSEMQDILTAATDARTGDRRRVIYRPSRRVSIDLCRPCLACTWPEVAAHENARGPPRTGRVSRRRRNGEDPPLLLPDASASVNAPTGFFKRGDRRLWGDGRREGPRADVCPVRDDPDDPILPEATAPSDRHGIAAARTGPGPTRSEEGVGSAPRPPPGQTPERACDARRMMAVVIHHAPAEDGARGRAPSPSIAALPKACVTYELFRPTWPTSATRLTRIAVGPRDPVARCHGPFVLEAQDRDRRDEAPPLDVPDRDQRRGAVPLADPARFW